MMIRSRTAERPFFSSAPNVPLKVDDEDEKDVLLWQTLEAHRNEKVLVYVDRRAGKRSTEDLSRVALQKEFKAAFFHGAMSTDEKIEVIRKFKAGELELVFATSAFGMGIDIPDIRGVIHYLLPEVHRAVLPADRTGGERRQAGLGTPVLFGQERAGSEEGLHRQVVPECRANP